MPKYYYKYRPPGIGCQPDGFTNREAFPYIQEVDGLAGRYHGFVEYPEPLRLYDAWRFDLVPENLVERARMVFFDAANRDDEKAEEMIQRRLAEGEDALRLRIEHGGTSLDRAALVILEGSREEESHADQV